ncbi:MAG: hypothetical protein HYR64_00830 [Fimbriimonas ginsengisoli]|uniref:Uncharacterized protein n=1 Tax=Fimbriimonas ginsengisoli TaxID=1005039 RepID=A0A931LVH8_FIMGI|nr:hypothetical protein [Fimbriimonas ginsengisoli]
MRKSKADAKGRIALGPEFAGREFVVRETKSGLLIEPVRTVTVPEDEAWLWENPVALRLVLDGIQESKAGKGRLIGSFSEFADVDPDE